MMFFTAIRHFLFNKAISTSTHSGGELRQQWRFRQRFTSQNSSDRSNITTCGEKVAYIYTFVSTLVVYSTYVCCLLALLWTSLLYILFSSYIRLHNRVSIHNCYSIRCCWPRRVSSPLQVLLYHARQLVWRHLCNPIRSIAVCDADGVYVQCSDWRS